MEIRKLEIRRIKEEELGQALKLVWDVFEQEIKPSYSEEGVQEFLRYIDYNFMNELYTKGDIIFWGAFEEELIGTVAVRTDGHISLFFVKNEYQGQGVGKALFQMMYNYCVEELKVKKITVNASPQSVAKYIHMGMRQMGNMEERCGIRSVPMEMYASPTLVKPIVFGKKKSRKRLWIILISILVLLIVGIIVSGIIAFKNFVRFEVNDNIVTMPYEQPAESMEEASGVEAIEEYEKENLPYEIVDETYSFMDKEKIQTMIDFHVQYPKLSVINDKKINAEVVENVNQAIYDHAMQTVEKIYLNPSDEIKEKVIEEDQPVLVSYVTYKVTYMSENLLSIVMEDQSYQGSQDEYVYDFRTLNVNLKDGSIYEVKDIVKIDNDFVKDWLDVMREEADNGKLLDELNKRELKKALEGESFDGVYDVEFFFDEDGIEIGFAFNYEEGDENDAGYSWVTAPFKCKEIKKYTTDSMIWDEFN